MTNVLLWSFAWLWRVVTLGKGWREIHVGGQAYLLRLYIWPQVYLHHFYSADTDRAFHSHPWDLSRTRILSGWYLEQSLCKAGINARVFSAGDRNTITSFDFHRIAAIGPGTWTLFRPGTRVQPWGFLDVETGTFRIAEDQT